MIEIGAFEAKTHLSRLLDQVEKGETITITRHGTAVAKLTPVSGPDKQSRQQAIARLKAFSKDQTLDGLSVRDLRDEGRR